MKLLMLAFVLVAIFGSIKALETDEDDGGDEDDAVVFAKKMSLEEIEDEDEKEDDEKLDKSVCKDVSCKTGRVCRANDEGLPSCVCGDEDHCRGHSKRVCGSDGRFYASHCELHRVSCVQGSRLGVDHSNKRCMLASVERGDASVLARTAKTSSLSSPTLQGTSKATDFIHGSTSIKQKKVVETPTSSTTPSTTTTVITTTTTTFTITSSSKTTFSSTTNTLPTTTLTSTTTLTPTTTKTVVEKVCSPGEFMTFKTALMKHHCTRIGKKKCMDSEQKKPKAVTEMFDFLDKDENKLLTLSEMESVSTENQMNELSDVCGMKEIFLFEDVDEDDIIDIEEFYRAFGVYDSGIADEPPVTFTTLVTVGNALELKCDLPGVDKVIWKRMGVPLVHSEEIKIFDDNSMYIEDLQLHHMGNYSCHAINEDYLSQTHIIIVQMPPTTSVFPSLQILPHGGMTTLKCHVDSVPQSEVQWSLNGKVISTDLHPNHPLHLFLQENNTTLKVKSNSSESSEFKCEAKNSAGSSTKSSSVTFLDEPIADFTAEATERYVAFHDTGYTVYDLGKCSMQHNIDKQFQVSLPNIVTPLCADKCQWGGATLVGDELLYIVQPSLKRVLVIELVDQINPIEVIKTDEVPLDVSYIPHLDQVWLTLCGDKKWSVKRGVKECKEKVVRVVSRASRSIQHQTVHLKNQDGSILKFDKLFLPKGENLLNEKFNNGYYTVTSRKGFLNVLDLTTLQASAALDLKEHDCEPVDLSYVPIGGYLFVSCLKLEPSKDPHPHLIIDYTTRKVLKKSDIGGGSVFVSPDSRNVVILEENGNVFSVYKLTADGRLSHLFDEYTEMNLNHITFFESGSGYGYNSFAVSYKFNTILHLDLSVGKVTMIDGPEGLFTEEDIAWNRRNRKLSNGRMFMNQLVTSSRETITGLNAKKQSIQCHWPGVHNAFTILPLPIEQGGLKY